MPEDKKLPTNTPRRHRPSLTELAKETMEEDLWDLDDGDHSESEASKSVKIEPRVEPAPLQEEIPEERPVDDIDEPELGLEEAAVEPAPVAPQEKAEPSPAPTKPSSAAPEPESPSPGPEEASEPADLTAPSLPSKLARNERIGLGVMAAVFLTVAIWWLVGSFGSLPTTRLGEDEPSFPVEGRFAVAQFAESFWRKPIRNGENADIARGDVLHIPVVEVTIEGTSNGVLRAIFRDDEGEFVGDSITQTFTAGQFDRSRAPKVQFSATSGFTEEADFSAYRVGGERWTVELLEGPSANASGSEFKSLFVAPISSLQR